MWFLTTKKSHAGQGRSIGEWAARQSVASGVRLIAVLDHLTDPRDFDECVWTLLNNIDPERDVQVLEAAGSQADAVFVMDGTPKLPAEGFHRGWPDKLAMPEDVKKRVDEIWPRATT